MDIVVQKFGGTSLSNKENREKVINKILEKVGKGYKVIVVVSAMGRKGEPYSTDTLINLVDEKSLNKRELDLLMSCGEIISAVVLSSLLATKGYDSEVLTGFQAGIITDNNYGEANVLEVNPQRILSTLEHKDIIIVTGFQGVTKDGDITTLGRGGSDTSALILGEAFGCNYVEIYTDVEGIMTADPKIVSDAQLISKMCYSEVYQLVEEGASFLHPKAVEIASRCNIDVFIKSSYKDCKGTIISRYDNKDKKLSNKNSIITAITYKTNRTQITIYLDNDTELNRILNIISSNNISIDLINLLPEKILFTINSNDVEIIENILNKENIKYNILKNCGKISIIGHKINGLPGVLSRIVNSLIEVNVPILQTSDSNTTIGCLILEKDLEKSLIALHDEFYKN